MKRFSGCLAVLSALAVGAGGGAYWAMSRAPASSVPSGVSIASIVEASAPIAELASRKVSWRVKRSESSVSRDRTVDTVYTIKTGYDLSDPSIWSVDDGAGAVVLKLPPMKIISIDGVLGRRVEEKATFFARVFSNPESPSETDAKDMRRLAEDCAAFGLLSGESVREGLVQALSALVKEKAGLALSVVASPDPPAEDMFNAYFASRGAALRL